MSLRCDKCGSVIAHEETYFNIEIISFQGKKKRITHGGIMCYRCIHWMDEK